ncbi:MAG TPA: hypothetical protein VLD39_06690, partial [Gammaproteobacteria bacterium]|nr:hypothetical protein [Gammaproteobacteria bacterium]
MMRRLFFLGLAAALAALLASCGAGPGEADVAAEQGASLDQIAERYVKAALAFRAYDESYVDAYYGPSDWSSAAEARSSTLDELEAEAVDALVSLEAIDVSAEPVIVQARKDSLGKRLRSMLLRMDMAAGTRVPF